MFMGIFTHWAQCLSDVERADVDLVVFGGDVAAGPMPVETIEELAKYSKSSGMQRHSAVRSEFESLVLNGRQ